MNENSNNTGLEIAVIGMAGRFPGARNVGEYWDNLKKGIESVAFFSDEELEQAGISGEQLNDPDYVKVMGYLEGIDTFDSDFFEYTPVEAGIMDPQLRQFHECAWEALEDAGYIPDTYDGLIGLYAGALDSFYWKTMSILSGKTASMGVYEVEQLTNKDYLCARIAYKLDLSGPVVFVQTACSTSLVAIHLGCQALISGETDIALAGGVSIIPFRSGHHYEEGMIKSPDGHCRAFDGKAKGTLAGNGLGIVVLKRLEEAVEDGDQIHAVIKGSAINNDGQQKVGFTAPSVDAQCNVIKDALEAAEVEVESIGYVEAHGTGTILGDPVEMEALTLAYQTNKRGFCGIGSVKSNFGHLDNAAGAAGFIKTVLALKHRFIPPTLHFDTPNKNIDLIDSPFYINSELRKWETNGGSPLRAGVSSLGIGGTNVHVILEEWRGNRDTEGQQYQLIVLSAKRETALEALKKNLAEYLKKNPLINLADAAYTLQLGRKAFKYRWAALCSTIDEAIRFLTFAEPGEPGEDKEHILNQMGRSWLSGSTIDWTAFYAEAEEKHCRISLPTYPFEPIYYAIEGNPFSMAAASAAESPVTGLIGKNPDIAQWFYIPSWKRVQPLNQTMENAFSTACWMVLTDESGFGSRVIKLLKEMNREIITVSIGKEYVKENDENYSINPEKSSDYDRLFKDLKEIGKQPVKILHLWNLYPLSLNREPLEEIPLEQVESIQYRGFYSLLFLVKAMDKTNVGGEVQLGVVTSKVQDVTGQDPLCPELSPVMGPVKVIPQEFPYIICRSIDLVLPPPGSRQEQRLIRQIIAELYSQSLEPVIAYRGNYRWVRTYEPLPLEKPGADSSRLRKKGVYLVTGGLGNIGFTLARFLVEQVRAKLILVGRSFVPEGEQREQWLLAHPGDDPVSARILKLKELENMGAEYLFLEADVGNPEQMEQVVVKGEECFGPINGVFHAAGDTGQSITCPIGYLDEAGCKAQFQARVYGLLVLEKVLREKELDFCVVVSSLVTVLGGLGFAAYGASIVFMDTLVHYHNRHHPVPWLSIGTAEWLFKDLAAHTRMSAVAAETIGLSMTVAEGLETFKRVLSHCREGQVVVSTGDLQPRIDKWVKLESLRGDALSGKSDGPSSRLHSRPELSRPYVPPSPSLPVQQEMVEMWQKFFGIEPIGIDDDFFELGGDSLKVITLVSKLHKKFNVRISIEEFFRQPVIRKLSAYIEKEEAGDVETYTYTSIEPVEKKEYYPLSSAQKRLYFLQQMDPAGTGYNIPTLLPLGVVVEKDKLETALKKLIARHESLRTSFRMVGDMPVQEIRDEVEFEIEYCNLNGKAREGAQRISDFVRPFDLSQAPLVRSSILESPDGSHNWMVDIHHIVSDGISQTILIEDFLPLYNGMALEPLRLQYKDFSEWQNRLFAGSEIKTKEDYWLDLYWDAGEIPRLNLPADHRRPSTFTFAGDHFEFGIEREDVVRFRELGSAGGATLYMNLLAAVNTLFYKYTGQEDIIIGSGIAGRSQADLDRIIGIFVNTLAIRSCPRGEQTYEFFLKEVVKSSLKAFENQDVQFEDLVNKLDLARDPSRNPLFDISIVGLNFGQPGDPGEGGEESLNIAYKNPSSRFDMTFFVREIGEEVHIDIEYYTGIFERETIQRLAVHFKNVVKAVIENPSVKLHDLEIITQEERIKVLYEFNDTGREYPKDKTIHELFAEQAKRRPDGTAVTFEDQMITYSELDRRSDGLAAYLHARGVGMEDAVGIMSDRCLEMVTGILGILKAGGAYLPIAPGSPEERQRYITADSDAGILITTQDIVGNRLACSADMDASTLTSTCQVGPANLAYIIYTSGSTGKPKGVMVDHGSVVRLVKNTDYIEFTGKDRLLLNGALEFDISTFEIWGPLLNGSALYLAGKDTLLDAESVGDILSKYDISILHLIPLLFNKIAGQNPAIFERLAYLLVGGDLVSPGYIDSVRNRCSGVTILHMYGPTENTTFSCFIAVNRAYENNIPIGKPVANSTVFILGQNRELMPVGIAGEICTGGDGVARGYLNQPELTAEKFCLRRAGALFEKTAPAPRKNFLLKSKGICSHMSYIYRTGDLGRWLADGNIEFLGRADFQVKIRGVRIELGEIENRLLAREEIKEAVVLAVREGLEAKYLSAYIVSDGKFDPSQLREMLSGDLPPAMIPSYFVQMDNMPLTATGKIDRKRLPDPVSGGGVRAPFIAPGNEIERQLAKIWSTVLELDGPVSIEDNFFDLGGHSLNAAVITSKIHRELEVKVALAEIFRKQTIRTLAEYIKGTKKSRYDGINPVEKREYYSLSSAQKRLYLLQQMKHDGIGYNMPLVLPLGKDVEKERLESIFRKLTARHESLRTSFITVEDMPVQKIHDEVVFEIEYYDLTAKTREGTRILKDFVRPFDLSKAPLLRSGIIKTPEGNHTWIIDMHHIISDGTSQAILAADFISLYNGKELKPSVLSIQYKDFSAWQNRLFSDECGDIKTQQVYWLELHAGEIPRLNLPADFRRPEVFTFAGSNFGFSLKKEYSEKIKQLCSGSGTTLFMNFLALLNTLFYKYTAQTDIIIGSGIAGRPHAGLQQIIGMFVNTLAMRNRPEGEKTYEFFLKEVGANTIRALENQDVPFEHLVDKLDIERNTSGNPLFDISMVVQNFMSAGKDNRQKPDQMETPAVGAKFDMTFSIIEGEEDIFLNIEYYTAVFKKETILRLASHFKNVVKTVIENPSVKLKDIELITEEEKEQVLYEFNDTVREYPKDKTIHELFAEQAKKRPDNVVLVGPKLQTNYKSQITNHKHISITYRELNKASDQLAYLLLEKGVQTDAIVGIMLERSVEMVIGILGILKAGGAYLPIGSGYPEERMRYITADSDAGILITTQDIVGNRLACSADMDALTSTCRVGPANMAYIIYTSGSTGRPKGVMVDHGSVVRLVKNTGYIEFTGKDRLLLNGALGFDISTFEIWGPLLNGSALYLAGQNALLDAEGLKDTINKYDISVLHLIPPLFNKMAEQNPAIFERLTYLMVGGDLVRPGYIDRVRKRCGKVKILHMYGPTENTTFSSFLTVNRAYENSIPIGKPVTNSTVFILGQNNELMPVGIAGEICTGGDGVARGYLNRPELTKEKFQIADYKHMSYIYRTGDLGRWLPDGNIEFLGRADFQVKIRGVRIELEEIENHLLAEEEIEEAVVLAPKEGLEAAYLCAYIVSERRFESPELREILSRHLPQYMIPSYFVQLDSIPLTPTGKIDRKTLLDVALEGKDRDISRYIAPGNSIELKLAEIWCDVLEADTVEPIGIEDNFFDLGGHSLNAAILTSRIHKDLQVKVPLVEVFKRQTIKALAAYIKQTGKTIYRDIDPTEKKEYYALSSAQKRLYLIQQMNLNGTGYNMPQVLPLGKDVDINKLESVFKKLIARHESLRTSFIKVEDMPVQKVHHEVPFEIECFDLTAKARQGTQRIKDFIRPFDLSQAPLLRLGLIKTEEQEHVLLVDMHHIISDGTSHRILTEDVMSLFSGKELGMLRLHYKDFSQWQNRLIESGGIKGQEIFWQGLFPPGEEIPRLHLPADFKRPEVFTFAGDNHGFKLDREEAVNFKALGSAHGATLYMNILALLNTLFYKYTGQEDIIIGSGIAGRPHGDLQRIIGMFVNTLAMRNYPKGEKSYRSFLEEVATRSVEAFDNQDVQFEHLVDELDIRRDTSRNPLFDVSMAVQNVMDFKEDYRETSRPMAPPVVGAKFDMTFSITEAGEDIYFNIEYYTGIFKKETVQRLASHLKHIIKSVVEKPAVKLKDIGIITEEEKAQVLYEFNDTGREYPKDKTIHELFAEQVEKRSDNTAVIFEDRMITYSELNRKSDGLAGYLHEKGVGKGEAVGIMLDRCLEMVIGILGILKAGGAYLPIAPGYPEERKRYITADSDAGILITTQDIVGNRLACSADMDTSTCQVGPANLAYIIYTSGSTGKPKGVMVEHTNVVRLVKNTGYIEFTGKDRLLLNGALEFDISSFEIWGPLLNGSAIYLAGQDALLDAQGLRNTLNKYDISILHLIPSLFNKMAEQDPAIFERLTYLMVGGDLVRPGYMDRVRKRCGSVKILHMYGPTENTTFSSFLAVTRAYENNIPIGKPVANSTVFILGQNNELMPVGIAGEICTGGDGVARGYLNRPELTKEKFCLRRAGALFEKTAPAPRKNLLLKSKGICAHMSYIYRTGDLGRWLADGNIEFLGRADLQVKVRGVRIELEEIENHLLAEEAIKEAVVLALKEGLEVAYLCAYIVSERRFESPELREILSGHLPSAMIPSYFVQLDEMPLTPTGKINRKALPDPVLESQGRHVYVAPRDELEEKLAAIWWEVLEADEQQKIGIDDNFFELGGHSLKAAIIVSKIHKVLDVKIPLAEVFKNQTIRALSEFTKKAAKETFIEIQPVDKKEYYPLSFNQKRLWFLQQRDPENNSFNMPDMIILNRPVEETAIKQTLGRIMESHESLRTGFKEISGEAVQYVVEGCNLPFNSVDISSLNPGEKEAELKKIIDAFNLSPFRLDEPPLIRSLLVKVREDEYVFAYNMHHIISDGWSMEILSKSFHKFYSDIVTGSPVESAPSPVTYKDFACWHNRQLADGGSKKTSREFWIRFLNRELPPLRLPGVLVDNGKTKSGAEFRFVIPANIKDALKKLNKEYDISLFSSLYTLYNIFLSGISGQQTVVTGILNAGRDHPSLQQMVGFFVNSVIFKMEIDLDARFIDFTKEVRDTAFEFFKHQNYPLELVLDEVGIQYPEVTVSFNMLNLGNNEDIPLENPAPSHYYTFEMPNVKFDLEVFVSEYKNGIEVNAMYNKNILKAESMEFLMDKYRKIIEFFALNPLKQLKDYKETKQRKSFKRKG